MFLYKIIDVSNIDIGNQSRPANHNNYHCLYLSRKGKETKFEISYWLKMAKNEICVTNVTGEIYGKCNNSTSSISVIME